MSELLKVAESVLAAMPFAAHVGGRITRFEPGLATLELEIDDTLRQQYGLVHGGVLAYAADNALTFAAGTVLGTSIITNGFTINYLRPARNGLLRAEAQVAHNNERMAVCTVTIDEVSADGTTTRCAIAQGTASTTSRSGTATS